MFYTILPQKDVIYIQWNKTAVKENFKIGKLSKYSPNLWKSENSEKKSEKKKIRKI